MACCLGSIRGTLSFLFLFLPVRGGSGSSVDTNGYQTQQEGKFFLGSCGEKAVFTWLFLFSGDQSFSHIKLILLLKVMIVRSICFS
jgi:hypothetical protein